MRKIRTGSLTDLAAFWSMLTGVAQVLPLKVATFRPAPPTAAQQAAARESATGAWRAPDEGHARQRARVGLPEGRGRARRAAVKAEGGSVLRVYGDAEARGRAGHGAGLAVGGRQPGGLAPRGSVVAGRVARSEHGHA